MTLPNESKPASSHLLVDTLGLVLGVVVTPANTTERAGAQLLLGRVLGWFTWLRILWVDGGYTGAAFAQWVKGLRPKLAVITWIARLIRERSPPEAIRARGAAGYFGLVTIW